MKAPLVAECLVNLECRVTDASMVRQYSLFILEAVKAWIDPSARSAGRFTTMATAPSWSMAEPQP